MLNRSPASGIERVEERVHRPRGDRERHGREQPRDGALVRLAGVELPLEVAGVADDGREHRAPVDERPPLLEREREDEREKAHRGRFMRRGC